MLEVHLLYMLFIDCPGPVYLLYMIFMYTVYCLFYRLIWLDMLEVLLYIIFMYTVYCLFYRLICLDTQVVLLLYMIFMYMCSLFIVQVDLLGYPSSSPPVP